MVLNLEALYVVALWLYLSGLLPFLPMSFGNPLQGMLLGLKPIPLVHTRQGEQGTKIQALPEGYTSPLPF